MLQVQDSSSQQHCMGSSVWSLTLWLQLNGDAIAAAGNGRTSMDGQQIGVYVSAPWLKFQAYSDNISPSNSFMDGDVHFFFFLVAKTTFPGTKLWCISRPFWLTLYKVLGGKCLRIGSWLLMLSFQDEVFCFHFETDGTSPHMCSSTWNWHLQGRKGERVGRFHFIMLFSLDLVQNARQRWLFMPLHISSVQRSLDGLTTWISYKT